MLYAILGTTGVVWSAGYLLWMYQRVFYGPIHHDENRALPDLDGREQISLWPLMAMALIMGVASPLWMKSIDKAVAHTLPPAPVSATTNANAASPSGSLNGLQK